MQAGLALLDLAAALRQLLGGRRPCHRHLDNLAFEADGGRLHAVFHRHRVRLGGLADGAILGGDDVGGQQFGGRRHGRAHGGREQVGDQLAGFRWKPGIRFLQAAVRRVFGALMASQARGAQVGVEFGDAGFILVDDGLDVQIGDVQRRQFHGVGGNGGLRQRHGGGKGCGQQGGARCCLCLVHVISPQLNVSQAPKNAL